MPLIHLFGRKSRRAELGQRPPGFWSQISTNLWFGPLPPTSVCLQAGICKYTTAQRHSPSGGLGCLSLPPPGSEVYVWRGGYKRVPSLEYTTQGDCTETPQEGFIIVVFYAANLRSCGRTHIPAPRELSVVFSSGVKFCTSNLREGY